MQTIITKTSATVSHTMHHDTEFLTLCYKFHLDLHHFALSLCRDAHLSDDLVQSTYLKAHRYQETYRNDINLRAWLFTMLKRIWLTHCTRQQRRNTHSVADIREAGEVPNNAISNMSFEEIEQVLQELDALERLAIEMKMDRCRGTEMAKALKMPAKNIPMLVYKTRRKLIRKIDRQSYTD